MASAEIYFRSKITQIFIKTLRGKTLTLDIDINNDKILDIKNKIFEIEGINPKQQMLTFCGKKLESYHTMKYYKITEFCTIDLSLKLLSSPTNILLKLRDSKQMKIEFTPFTTLKDIKHRIHINFNNFSSSYNPEINRVKSFVHNDKILQNDNIRITEIDDFWSDLTLHTKYGEDFQDSKFIKYRIFHKNEPMINIESMESFDNKLLNIKTDKTMIDKLIYNFLCKTSINPLFYSGYCPIKKLIIIYNNTKLQLRLNDSTEYAEPFNSTNTFSLLQKCRTEEFGLLPQIQLNVITQYLSKCDCCPLQKLNGLDDDGYIVSTDNISGVYDKNIIQIEVELADISFILHNKYYYINGRFYKKYDSKKKKINLQFYPIMRSPQKLNEELLIYGYIKNKSKYYKHDIPMDVIKVIILFYPAMYGGHYDINDHNPNLNNQLQQKTDIFIIDDINCYLKFGSLEGGNNEEQYLNGKGSYYLVLDFSNQKEITVLVILCCIYCKISKQSYTFIRSISFIDNNIQYIELPDFGITSSLSSLICDIQIINMLKSSNIYEYPLILRQSAYFLEWQIDEILLNIFKQSIINNISGQSFESEIFYNLFKLRCYPNEKGRLLLSIQLLSLPINRPNKDKISGLTTKCQIYETETNIHIPSFDATFDFTEDNSAFTTILMKTDTINNKKQLRFRIEIIIYDPTNPQFYLTELNTNYHHRNAKRGIMYQRGRRGGRRRSRGRGN